MVHALEKIHGLLQPGGLVLDIHDMPGTTRFMVQRGQIFDCVGRQLSRVDFEKLHWADQALAQVVDDGWFHQKTVHVFDYSLHLDSLMAFEGWLGEQWDTSYLAGETRDRVVAALCEDGAKVSIRRASQMTLLQRE
jgi:hypothetical protein